MILTQAIKQKPNWAAMIRRRRLALKETQEQFGKRFGVGLAAVSHWENGQREAPYEVTWWLYKGGKR